MTFIVDDIKNLPGSVVEKCIEWCKEDFIMNWEKNKDEYTTIFGLNETETYDEIMFAFNEDNTREALITFVLMNDDCCLAFSKTGWEGFTLFKSPLFIDMIITTIDY
jgi:hypothetical protein